MSRPRHNRPEYERFLKQVERTEVNGKKWTVTGGGDRHFKVRCPSPCKCMTVVSTTPKRGHTMQTIKDQMRRFTCWREDGGHDA